MTVVVDAEHDEIRISLQNLENVRRRYFLGRRAFDFSLRAAHGGDRPEVKGNELISLMFDPSKTPQLYGNDGFFDVDPGRTAVAAYPIPKMFWPLDFAAGAPTTQASGDGISLVMRYHVSGQFWDSDKREVVSRECVKAEWGPRVIGKYDPAAAALSLTYAAPEWSQPPIPELQAPAESRLDGPNPLNQEAKIEAYRLFLQHWTPMQESWIARRPDGFVEVRSLRAWGSVQPLSPADKLNNIEWRGTISYHFSVIRAYVPTGPQEGWTEWRDFQRDLPGSDPFGTWSVDLIKQDGKWKPVDVPSDGPAAFGSAVWLSHEPLKIDPKKAWDKSSK